MVVSTGKAGNVADERIILQVNSAEADCLRRNTSHANLKVLLHPKIRADDDDRCKHVRIASVKCFPDVVAMDILQSRKDVLAENVAFRGKDDVADPQIARDFCHIWEERKLDACRGCVGEVVVNEDNVAKNDGAVFKSVESLSSLDCEISNTECFC